MQIIAYPISMSGSNIKIFSYYRAFMPIGKTLLHLSYLCGCQFSVMSTFSSWRNMRSNAPRMTNIIKLGNPFQIVNMIVEFIGIFMINFCQSIWIWQKSKRNKAMNQYIPNWFLSVSQNNSSVSRTIDSPFQSSRFLSASFSSKRPRANMSAFGNFVQSFVAPNRGVGFSIHALMPNSILGYVNV